MLEESIAVAEKRVEEFAGVCRRRAQLQAQLKELPVLLSSLLLIAGEGEGRLRFEQVSWGEDWNHGPIKMRDEWCLWLSDGDMDGVKTDVRLFGS
jgi:hypothetical protein